jgi:hypothetical protein
VTRHNLEVKGSIYLTISKDNRSFPTRFIICKNFPYEAIIGSNFLKTNNILLDVANSKFIYPLEKRVRVNNTQNNSTKVKINYMKEYRDKQIQEITKLWKEIVRLEPSNNKPNKIVLKSINTKTSGKYYGFLVRKSKFPPKSMQRVQISQMIAPINDKKEIWIASPIEDIPKN